MRESKAFFVSLAIPLTFLLGIGFLTPQNYSPYVYTADVSQVASSEESAVVPNLTQAYQSSVVILSSQISVRGSGTILQYKEGKRLQVLTAWHVVEDIAGEQIHIGLIDSEQLVMATVTKFDPVSDLALLTSITDMREDGPQATMATQEPVLGETIWTIGNPRGVLRNVSKGILGNILDLGDGRRYYRIDAAMYYGCSGGGIFNSAGHLVGVMHGIEYRQKSRTETELVPGGGLCITLKQIQELLGG